MPLTVVCLFHFTSSNHYGSSGRNDDDGDDDDAESWAAVFPGWLSG